MSESRDHHVLPTLHYFHPVLPDSEAILERWSVFLVNIVQFPRAVLTNALVTSYNMRNSRKDSLVSGVTSQGLVLPDSNQFSRPSAEAASIPGGSYFLSSTRCFSKPFFPPVKSSVSILGRHSPFLIPFPSSLVCLQGSLGAHLWERERGRDRQQIGGCCNVRRDSLSRAFCNVERPGANLSILQSGTG